jgi:hypothetical protein
MKTWVPLIQKKVSAPPPPSLYIPLPLSAQTVTLFVSVIGRHYDKFRLSVMPQMMDFNQFMLYILLNNFFNLYTSMSTYNFYFWKL